VGELTTLTRLDAFGCEALAALPVHLGQLASLRELDVSHSALTAFPDSIGELPCTSLHCGLFYSSTLQCQH